MDNIQYKHLVFYDGECGFCDCSVKYIMKIDTERLFAFAPLQGLTANKLLGPLHPQYKRLDTLILVEDFKISPKIYTEAKAVFRICWLVGGLWILPGLLFFLPSFLMDWCYRLVARNRSILGLRTTQCPVPKDQENRFLP
jgi:predicted DCC family thiol-disulfide oxidoreductase YuxK